MSNSFCDSGMSQRLVDPRMRMEVEQEVSLKDLELKTLKAREAVLRQQLELAEVNEEVVSLGLLAVHMSFSSPHTYVLALVLLWSNSAS